MKRGALIVIDGIDGSGKATQAELLVARLRREGYRAAQVDFPEYRKHFFGALIAECLSGLRGDFVHLDPRIASTLYAADRFEAKSHIEKLLAKGYVVVADRYTSSNQIHQGGKIRSTKERRVFLEWLDRMEHEVFGIPRPKAIVYLSLPVRLSLKLLAAAKKRGELKRKYLARGKPDVVESSIRYLENSRKNAQKIIKEKNAWVEIVCNKKDEVLPREIVHEKVWRAVEKVLRRA